MNKYIWYNEKIVKTNEAKVNVLSSSNQFGLNIFEGLRAYWNDEKRQLYVFRLDAHIQRLKNSIKLMELEYEKTYNFYRSAIIEILKFNKFKNDVAIRQTVFVQGIGSWMKTDEVGMFISAFKKGRSFEQKEMLELSTSSWKRIDQSVLPPTIKLGANYMNSRLSHRESVRNGYDTAIMLNKEGFISEAPGSCIFIVKNGSLITPNLQSSILDSITRKTIIEIAKKSLKLEVEERFVSRTEIYLADEIFLCGTSMEIKKVKSVDKQEVKNLSFTLTNRIIKKYFEIVRGKDHEYNHWLTSVYE